MELSLFNIFIALYLSSIIMLMIRLWWPIHKYMLENHPYHPTTKWWPVVFLIHLIGFIIGAPFLWGCILSNDLRARFCKKYVATILEET